MFTKLISYLFPYKFKIGDKVTCDDFRCLGRVCQVDRIYLRRDEKYVRIFFLSGYDKVSINIRASKCKLI
jgi:hypothetical protein